MTMNQTYDAASIEVLSGLDPVRKRPGMYTDTSRPNHLAQEVIDNSVDEALAGFARTIDVRLMTDGGVEVRDDGRGMPVDIHPEEGVSGVEVILTKLHAGGKFSNKSYGFSGGLHGVGVSVVNALSDRLDVEVRRDGKTWDIGFARGEKVRELTETGTCAKRDTGTTVRFWPEAHYFDSPRIAVPRLKALLRAKAVLCSGLRINLTDDHTGESESWYFENGLPQYLLDRIGDQDCVPEEPFIGSIAGKQEAVDWAVVWTAEGREPVTESYVNLVPTAQGVPM